MARDNLKCWAVAARRVLLSQHLLKVGMPALEFGVTGLGPRRHRRLCLQSNQGHSKRVGHSNNKMAAVLASAPAMTQVNGNGHPLTGDSTPDGGVKEPKFASGLILPPPEIKCTCPFSLFITLTWFST